MLHIVTQSDHYVFEHTGTRLSGYHTGYHPRQELRKLNEHSTLNSLWHVLLLRFPADSSSTHKKLGPHQVKKLWLRNLTLGKSTRYTHIHGQYVIIVLPLIPSHLLQFQHIEDTKGAVQGGTVASTKRCKFQFRRLYANKMRSTQHKVACEVTAPNY
jgi:hypothetical protein